MSDQHAHHSVDYVELCAVDLAAAKQFYSEAFGWTFTDYGPDYCGFRDGAAAREVGGVRKVDAAPSRGGPLIVLYSTDLDATLARVKSAGGTIVTEPFEFPGGRRFHFTDPSGNELGVWSGH